MKLVHLSPENIVTNVTLPPDGYKAGDQEVLVQDDAPVSVGAKWVGGQDFVSPRLSWSDPYLDPRYHWLDVGPFFDRFGAKALAVTGSADPQVQGLVTLLLPRKYVDLKRPDLPALLGMLVAKGILTSEEVAAILNPITTDYERHVKGMEQPEVAE